MISWARDRTVSRYGEVADEIRKLGLTHEKAYDAQLERTTVDRWVRGTREPA
jgi:hypothetical protein